MKNLLLLITLITLSCNPPSEPSVTYYNHDSTDGLITKIISDDSGIISKEQVEVGWEKVSKINIGMSNYEILVELGEKVKN